MKTIIVACGTGIATSTVVVKKLEEKLQEARIAHHIIQCKISEVASKAKSADLVVTTTTMSPVDGVPVIQALSFLTGIGMEADIEKIIEILNASQ